MEEHKLLKQMMDTLFGTLELNTWSIYQNKFGHTVCSLRFKDNDMRDCVNMQNVPISFKRKSASQQLRDKRRMEQFTSRRPHTRSQGGVVEEVEINRDNTDDNTDSDTDPITPVTVLSCFDQSASPQPLHLPDSPENRSSETSDLVSQEQPRLLHTEIMPETEISLPSLGYGSSGDTLASPASVAQGPLLEPDPPPEDVSLIDGVSADMDVTQTVYVDLYGDDVINEVMNKPDKDVSIRDVLRAMQSITKS